MDATLVLEALAGDVSIETLTIAERMALARADLVRVEVRPLEKGPARFLLPPAIERMYRGCSS